MAIRTLICALLGGLSGILCPGIIHPMSAAENAGQRPYELDWAGRTNDHCPPLVDFEDLTGWRATCQGAVATLEASQAQKIWGEHTAKVTYRATNSSPEVRLAPPQPIALGKSINAVSLWCYGNNWGYAADPRTPPVTIAVCFEDARSQEFKVGLHAVDWTGWHLLHKRLSPEQQARVQAGAKFKGLLITNGRNQQDRTLYLDNMAVFTERFDALAFEPRPERGIPMLPGQTAAANTGPGKLPFPTRSTTILPDNLTSQFRVSLEAEGGGYRFRYQGTDGQLDYRYLPKLGTWSDWEATWQGTDKFQPCVNGGVYLATDKGPAPPDKAEHLGTRQREQTVESHWRLTAGTARTEVTYVYRLWGKSLVLDVLAPGGGIAEVRFGQAGGLRNSRLVTNPYYPAASARPAVVISGSTGQPLFLTGHVDWYRSNGSELWAANQDQGELITYHGGTRYLPLNNGKRNDCFERFFLTISPRYEEMLPNIPNPASPWKAITGTRLWRAHGASNREQDKRYWENVHRHGMTEMIVTDHETMWRDEGESFTFRTRPAPGKGGEAGARDYSRFMQDKLGFIYGPYNNYTDFAPVNGFWDFDLVSRKSDNQLQTAWMRCYAPKPARAVEFCARLAPLIQDQFHFSTAYCDVHTAVAPWHRVDYDARVPGAGTFSAVFYAYGEIMLQQKKAWNGPVYSEGNYHAFYMGLTDGNYAQDQSYRPADNPWLVDFDLRKLHPLGCNFGMGNLEMFYANAIPSRETPAQRDAVLDRFLTATVAFGHPGFLVMEEGMSHALRSYYLLQQLQSRYCLADAADIRYATTNGVLLETSQALATGAYQRSQVVTRYADGTVTAANGSKSERLRARISNRDVDLPPNGFLGWTSDGTVEAFCGDREGKRCDYVASPAYRYVDGRGSFVRFPQAAGDGQGICRTLPGGEFEVICPQDSSCGFAINALHATALDKDRKELGPVEIRQARGLTYVMPVKRAFSYRLQASAPTKSTPLTCNREEVVPGERVLIRGTGTHEVTIATNAKPGQRLWFQFENAWIDFTVVPIAEMTFTVQTNSLLVAVTSHLPRQTDFLLATDVRQYPLHSSPGQPQSLHLDLGLPREERADILQFSLRQDDVVETREIGLLAQRQSVETARWPTKFTAGMRLRGQPETTDLGTSGTGVHAQSLRCGGVERTGLFMHPPWQGGTGYAYALHDPVTLPQEPATTLRAWVGKQDGSDPGDGILYQLAVLNTQQVTTVVTQMLVTRHEWRPLEADLSPWRGQTIRVKLVVDPGPKNNSSGDWAAWADLRLEAAQPGWTYSLVQNPQDIERLRREPGPFPVPGLTVAEVRAARAGWLRYDGRGLEGGGQYATQAVLNGVRLGTMSPAHGNEEKREAARNVGVKLTPDALRSLGRRNRVAIENPSQDNFAVGRFWLELELADGRRCSSEISTSWYTQPPGWPPGEGIGVPFSRDVSVDVWMEVRP